MQPGLTLAQTNVPGDEVLTAAPPKSTFLHLKVLKNNIKLTGQVNFRTIAHYLTIN